MRTYYLVRHGQTEWNAERRMQGRADSPLTPVGEDQAKENGRLLAKFNIDAAIASPMGRVRRSIELMSHHAPLSPSWDERLVEWDCGEWSGHLHKDLSAHWPKAFAAWEKNRWDTRPPGGENYEDLLKRGGAVLADLEKIPGDAIAIISHGMMGRALAHLLLGLSPKETMAIRQRNDIVIRIHLDDKGTWADHFTEGRGPKSGLPLVKR